VLVFSIIIVITAIQEWIFLSYWLLHFSGGIGSFLTNDIIVVIITAKQILFNHGFLLFLGWLAHSKRKVIIFDIFIITVPKSRPTKYCLRLKLWLIYFFWLFFNIIHQL